MFTLLVCYSSSEPVHGESTQVIGFPQFSIKGFSGEYVLSKPEPISEVLWAGIHKRLFLFESDVEDSIQNATNLYDMTFIDAVTPQILGWLMALVQRFDYKGYSYPCWQ